MKTPPDQAFTQARAQARQRFAAKKPSQRELGDAWVKSASEALVHAADARAQEQAQYDKDHKRAQIAAAARKKGQRNPVKPYARRPGPQT